MYDVGEIAQLCRIAQPHVGVVTNVGPVHLERLGTIERIAQAKAELVASAAGGRRGHTQRRRPAGGGHGQPDAGPGLLVRPQPRRRPVGRRDRRRGAGGHPLPLPPPELRFLHVRVPLLGRHSVHTALRAAAVGLVEGLSWEEIVRGLQQLDVQLRLIAVARAERRHPAGRHLQRQPGLDHGRAEPAGRSVCAERPAHRRAGRHAGAGQLRGGRASQGRRARGRRGGHAGHGRPAGALDRRGGAGGWPGAGQGAGIGQRRGRAG